MLFVYCRVGVNRTFNPVLRGHVPEPPGPAPDHGPEIPPPASPDEDVEFPPREDPAPVRDPAQPVRR